MGSPVIVLAMDTDSPSSARVGRRAWASMVTHMLELLDTPSDWRRAQSVSSMVTHRAASPLPICCAPSLPDPDPDPDHSHCASHLVCVGPSSPPMLPSSPDDSPPPSPLPCVSPCVPSPSSPVSIPPQSGCDLPLTPSSVCPSLPSLACAPSVCVCVPVCVCSPLDQDLVTFSSPDPANIEYETESECETPDLGERVITAFLQIPLYSPVTVRTGTRTQDTTTSTHTRPGTHERLSLPLSPLTELSQRLSRRLAAHRQSLETVESSCVRETATQTSACSSISTLWRSPTVGLKLQESPNSVTSSDLPSLSSCDIRASLSSPADTPHSGTPCPFSLEGSPRQDVEIRPRDSTTYNSSET